MANRRMFSKEITNSSEFLMMSPSAQNLYFHFGMNADDDGFCEVFTVMRMTDSKPDDLQNLHQKGFIFVVDSKIGIVKDWHKNNQLRLDRYSKSVYLNDPKYKEIYFTIMDEKVKELAIYQSFLPSGNHVATKGYHSIGKDSIVKDREEHTETKVSDTLEAFISNNYELTQKYENEEMVDYYIDNKKRTKRSLEQVKKDYADHNARQKTQQKATEKREETMSLLNKNAVKILCEMQGISKLDGVSNYKSADNVIKAIRLDMIANHLEVPENEIEMLAPLQVLLEKIRDKSPFHWKNMTSFGYLDKWFNKITKEVL